MSYSLVKRSKNAKTGPIPTSTSTEKTCPPSCPLSEVCYAKRSFYQWLHWLKVTAGLRGDVWLVFVAKVAALASEQLWRHNVSGDLPGIGERINGRMLRQLVKANEGKRGFTYTHKLPHIGNNAAHIKAANADGFTINLSANTLAEADRYAALKIGPVVVVLDMNQMTNTATPRNRKVVICPAIKRDDVTCATCGLCQVRDRKVIVGFPAHANGKREASLIARG